MEAIRSSETSGSLKIIRRYNPESRILHGHQCEKLKSKVILTFSSTHTSPQLVYKVARLAGVYISREFRNLLSTQFANHKPHNILVKTFSVSSVTEIENVEGGVGIFHGPLRSYAKVCRYEDDVTNDTRNSVNKILTHSWYKIKLKSNCNKK
jgi:hypothetical protein